jgi:FK506-binding protein 2
MLDMCVGEKRKLIVPPKFGYGYNRPVGPIPGGSTLIYETELVEILDTPEVEGKDEKKETEPEKGETAEEEVKEGAKDEL